MTRQLSYKNYLSVEQLQFLNTVWLFSVLAGGMGIIVIALFDWTDHYFSLVERTWLFTASLIFMSWLYFKPFETLHRLSSDYKGSRFYQFQSAFTSDQNDLYLSTTQNRMAELKQYHLISQDYRFPFPHLCQIYHLLNLKHLEDIHSFSLNNLKIVKISEFKATTLGGILKFQTILESPRNALRMWRKPLVEVDLILHTPFTVELNIPAYGDKRIIVIFNVLPVSDQEHQLFIDIYSNLQWPKPILQCFMHIAASLTVLEDFPYLQKLAQRNLSRTIHCPKMSTHETLRLFKRFAELYGASYSQPTAIAESA